jgi:hypothetical protein
MGQRRGQKRRKPVRHDTPIVAQAVRVAGPAATVGSTADPQLTTHGAAAVCCEKVPVRPAANGRQYSNPRNVPAADGSPRVSLPTPGSERWAGGGGELNAV